MIKKNLTEESLTTKKEWFCTTAQEVSYMDVTSLNIQQKLCGYKRIYIIKLPNKKREEHIWVYNTKIEEEKF